MRTRTAVAIRASEVPTFSRQIPRHTPMRERRLGVVSRAVLRFDTEVEPGGFEGRRVFGDVRVATPDIRGHHDREDRVSGHLFLCLLAAYVRWHLERAWAPLLFRDEEPPLRTDAVAPPERSEAAHAKERLHRTPEGLPVHGFRDLLSELGTLTRNRGSSSMVPMSRVPSRSSPGPPRSRHAPSSSRAFRHWRSSQSETADPARSVLDIALAAVEVRPRVAPRPSPPH